MKRVQIVPLPTPRMGALHHKFSDHYASLYILCP